MSKHTATITNWIATDEPMTALDCPKCGQLAERYNQHGVCLPCQKDDEDAEDVGYISGELVRAVGEGATAYIVKTDFNQSYGPAEKAGQAWAEFFNAAMEAVTVERGPADGDGLGPCEVCEGRSACAVDTPDDGLLYFCPEHLPTEPKRQPVEQRCARCKGTGELMDVLPTQLEPLPCNRCGGKGYVVE